MILGKVTGNLVSTHKHEVLKGLKFLFVQQLDENLNPVGEEVLAVDGVGAGIGDVVILISEGGSARQILFDDKLDYSPVEIVVAGIVDSIKTKDDYKFIK
jgi:microcompartment protein CcmK/EutM